jgi:hypothetical protein
LINSLVILFTLLSSYFKLYPFRSRPILFLIPILFSFLCALVDELLLARDRLRKTSGIVAAILFFGLVGIPAIGLFLRPTNLEDIKGGLAYIENHQNAGDKIALSVWSVPAFMFYRPNYNLDQLPSIASIGGNNDAGEFLNNLCADRQAGRIWILYSHRFYERTNLLTRIAAIAPLLTKWEGSGSGVYLFDFSLAKFCP